MRIDRLDFIAYGAFTEKSLDLSEGNSGLHIIYGNNEAGKSTSLRALIAWLFGIPVRTTDNFLHENSQLRIGGKLRLANGENFEFIRKKGNKDTILDYNTQTPLNQSLLTQVLPEGIDEDSFSRLWGIDHNRLIAGGEELMNQSGDLGKALYSAAIGASSLGDITADFKRKSDEIFKPRASTTLLNQAISQFKEANSSIKNVSLPVGEWSDLQKKQAEVEAENQQVVNSISNINITKTKLERLNRVKGALAERRSLLEQINAMGEVTRLMDDFEDKRRFTNNELANAKKSKQTAASRLNNFNDELKSLNVREELVEKRQNIGEIFLDLGAVEKTKKDIPMQDGKRRELRNSVEIKLKSIRSDISIKEVDELRPMLNNKNLISRLTMEYIQLGQNKKNAKRETGLHHERFEDLKKKVTELPKDQKDLLEIKAALSTARKAGNIEERLNTSQKRTQAERQNCQQELKRLGRFSGDLDSLMNLTLPVPVTLDLCEKDFTELKQKQKKLDEKKQELKRNSTQTEQSLKSLLKHHDVPAVADLTEARESRDINWNKIRTNFIDQKENNGLLYDADDNVEIATNYEKKVASADQLADRIRDAADQVIKRMNLEVELDSLTSQRQSIVEEETQWKHSNIDFQKRWSEIWNFLGIELGTPGEMKQWLSGVSHLIHRLDSLKNLIQDEENLKQICQDLKASISKQIIIFDSKLSLQDKKLEGMLALCEQQIQQIEKVQQHNLQLKQSLEDTENQIKKSKEELESIEQELSDWNLEWQKAIKGLGLANDVKPEQVADTMDKLENMFQDFDKSEEFRKRIYGMEIVLKKFEKKVTEFTIEIKYETQGLEAATIVRQMQNDLNDALAGKARQKEMITQIKRIQEDETELDITIENAENILKDLRKQAQVETNDELFPAGEKFKRMKVLENELKTIEKELNLVGDGLSIEELEKEYHETEVDSIDDDLSKIMIELRDLQEKQEQLRDETSMIKTEIKSKDGSAKAAKASEEAQEQLALIDSYTEQYLRLQIAASMLEKQIEEYRKKNQAPVLANASKIFSRLTLDSYKGLRDEIDDSGKPFIQGIRPNHKEVKVAGMSEGTRDQLYLALRLATLGNHLEKGEVVPFVVDDILVGFDDDRTKVCLEIFSELANKTQILLFTHHHRVVELAGNIKASAGLFTHQLS